MAASVKQSANGQSAGSTTTLTVTLPAAPTAGNLLVLALAGDKNTGALTLSGFTKAHEILGASTSLYVYYKISAGTETSISPSWPTTSAAGNTAHYMEIEDTAVSGSDWQIAGTAETTYSDTTTNSRSTNTTGTLTASALALATWALDSSQSWTSASVFTLSFVSE